MRTAFAVWGDRIAPVFDVAREILVAEKESGEIVRRRYEISTDIPVQRALLLVEKEIGTLVCGAISKSLETMLNSYGIRVIPFISGTLDEVVEAWSKKSIDEERFYMPGCCGRARSRFHTGRMAMEKSGGMGRRNRGGMGQGRGRGRGASGSGRPAAVCVCPNCDYREAHEPGIPCSQKKCPKCGMTLIRT